LNFIEEKHPDLITGIEKDKKLDDGKETKLKEIIQEYKGLF
jgi:F0F1-type ATP synthase alpha subunit